MFRYATVLGGFAAPLFLWLAGLAVVLAAAAVVRRGGSRRDAAEAVCRRGLEIFILAFLFRLQAFIVSPGSHPVTLFRVDILNIMGPAIVAAGLVWLCGGIAGAAGRGLRVPGGRGCDGDPAGANDPGGGRAAGVGAVVHPAGGGLHDVHGVSLGGVRVCGGGARRRADGRTGAAASPPCGRCRGGAGVDLDRLLHGLASVDLPQSSFWTSSPTYFAIRVGVMMAGLAALYAVEQAANRFGVAFTALERFGRRSLFVYWIHVELVYGYATWPLHGRLPLWGSGWCT